MEFVDDKMLDVELRHGVKRPSPDPCHALADNLTGQHTRIRLGTGAMEGSKFLAFDS